MADDSLLVFPCAFPIKIVGLRSDDFAQKMLEIVRRHAPDFDPSSLEMRPSRGGTYLSVTCVFIARSRVQLDALYRELTAHEGVRFVL